VQISNNLFLGSAYKSTDAQASLGECEAVLDRVAEVCFTFRNAALQPAASLGLSRVLATRPPI
jgi:hypothetical protein